jgi:hypothetical protein
VKRSAREARLWLGLGLAALLPRALGALLRPPWHDEYFTVWATGLRWSGLIAALRVDSGPPLPYAFVKMFTILGVPALAGARALAVVAGTAAVLLAARAARRRFGEEAGWWTGALVAVHPLAVAWSCEGRAYALLLLAVAWAWDRLGAVAEGKGGAVGLGLAVALACWSHGLGPILALVAAVVGLTLPRPARGRALVGAAGGLLAYLPWLPVAAHQPPAAVSWMAAAWHALSPAAKLAAPVRLLSPAGDFGAFLDLPSAPPWVEAGAALLAVILLVAGCRAWSDAWRPLVGAFLPAGALAVLAAIGVPAFYPGRGEALYLVPLLLLLGAGTVRSRALRAAGSLLVVVAAGVTVAALAVWAARPPSPEHRLAEALRQGLPEGGDVVIGGYWRLGVWYHLGTDRGRFDLVSYPASSAGHPGWYDDRSDAPAPGELSRLLAALRPASSRAAVVVTPGLATTLDLDRLAADLELQPAVTVPGARLWLPAGAGAAR